MWGAFVAMCHQPGQGGVEPCRNGFCCLVVGSVLLLWCQRLEDLLGFVAEGYDTNHAYSGRWTSLRGWWCAGARRSSQILRSCVPVCGSISTRLR